MDSGWIVLATAAVTGTLTVLAGALPKIIDAIRDGSSRKRKAAATRDAKVAVLRRLYPAAYPYLTGVHDEFWVNVIAAAADCIPYTEPDSKARQLLLAIIGHEKVDVEELIASLPGEK